jgi:hypothetical protein
MTYQPQPGDIGLTRVSGAVGVGIRLGQWLNGDGFADYEHAFVVVQPAADGTQMIVEAEPDAARHVAFHYDPNDTVYLRCPDRLRDGVAFAATRYTGVGYSAADYGFLALHRFHIPAPGLRSYIRSTHRMICSQLADRAALDGGWHLFADGRWEGDVTPGALQELYRQQQRAGAE